MEPRNADLADLPRLLRGRRFGRCGALPCIPKGSLSETALDERIFLWARSKGRDILYRDLKYGLLSESCRWCYMG